MFAKFVFKLPDDFACTLPGPLPKIFVDNLTP